MQRGNYGAGPGCISTAKDGVIVLVIVGEASVRSSALDKPPRGLCLGQVHF